MITYAITVADEDFEFKRLINSLQPYLFEDEEIVILADSNKVTNKIIDHAEYCKLNINFFDFQMDFSEFKNQLFRLSSKNYIFQIDADEQIPISLIYILRKIALQNEIDLLWIPRINKTYGIDKLEEKEDREKNSMGWKGFPDMQGRFFKNVDYIRWSGKVHETLHGSKNQRSIIQEPIELYSILHVKDKVKVDKQLSMYASMER
jgi:glycosyltransferase involved in cell wall biosynthesis